MCRCTSPTRETYLEQLGTQHEAERHEEERKRHAGGHEPRGDDGGTSGAAVKGPHDREFPGGEKCDPHAGRADTVEGLKQP